MFSGFPPADKCLEAPEESQGFSFPCIPPGTMASGDGNEGEIPYVCPRSLEVLPISNHRDKILGSIDRNRVTCIQGETGCGKSSMVPHFIVEEAVGSPFLHGALPHSKAY